MLSAISWRDRNNRWPGSLPHWTFLLVIRNQHKLNETSGLMKAAEGYQTTKWPLTEKTRTCDEHVKEPVRRTIVLRLAIRWDNFFAALDSHMELMMWMQIGMDWADVPKPSTFMILCHRARQFMRSRRWLTEYKSFKILKITTNDFFF